MASKKLIGDIQLLRAVAILLVLVHHSSALFPTIGPSKFQQGLWVGVDLFFCISGFVIMRVLLRQFPTQTTFADALKLCIPFWVARFWRIMPSAFFWLGVMLINAAIIDPNRLLATVLDAISALLQVSNLHFYNCRIHQAGMCGNGSIYWTLSLEFQFYLLLPLFLLICPRRYWAWGLTIALIVQLFITHSHWNNLLSFIRTESFILGALIALFHSRPEATLAAPVFLRTHCTRYLVFFLLVGLLCIAGNQYAALIPNPIALTALLSGALVFIASYNADYLLPVSRVKQLKQWVKAYLN